MRAYRNLLEMKLLRTQRAKSIGHCQCHKQIKELKDFISQQSQESCAIKKELTELKELIFKGSYNTASNPQYIAIMNIEKHLALYQARDQAFKVAKTVLKECVLIGAIGIIGDRMIDRYTKETTMADKRSAIAELLRKEVGEKGKEVIDWIKVLLKEDVKDFMKKVETHKGTTGAAETPGMGSATPAAK